jgi:hypothetical protein
LRVLPDDLSHGLRALDGYRAIAALAVVTTHVAFSTGVVNAPIIGPITSRMDFGVCLFFLLSGFLLYRPWARSALAGTPSPDIRVYSVRRALRIFPAYLVMATFTLALLPEIQPVPLTRWLDHLTLTHIYTGPVLLEGLTQTWSLATEVSFYIALPMVAWAMGRRFRGDPARSFRWQVVLLVAVSAISAIVNSLRGWSILLTDPRWSWLLPSYLDWFAVGMFLVLVREMGTNSDAPASVRALRRLAADVPACLIIAACLYALACTPIAGSLTPFGDQALYALHGPWAVLIKHWLYALSAAFLLLPAFLAGGQRSRWLSGLSSPVMTYLGTVSYGIFLWHLVILQLLIAITGVRLFSGGFWWIWPATVLLSVGAASISWFLLERPCQALSHRYRPRTQREESPPPPLPQRPRSEV